MFEILSKRAGKTGIISRVFLELSIYLGRPTSQLLLKRALYFLGGYVTVGVSVIIFIFEDDAMEGWVKKSVYRGKAYKNEKPYKGMQEELGELHAALLEIV